MNNDVEILVVEDSPTQAELLKHLLEQHNYHVSVACNGREALALLDKRKPTIVISDIVMPEMDGYQLCRHIKTDENLKCIPVILLTALSDPGDVIKGLECGADNFITKPYDEKYLLSRIQYILVNRRLRGSEKVQVGVEITFAGQKYFITSERQQILDLLISTYEVAVWKNIELIKTQEELRSLNEELERKVEERTASLRAEIEVRRRAEEELSKVNRALRTLSEGNRALVRSAKESELFHEICRIIVEIGEYRHAWIGFAEQDEKKTVRHVAQYGYEEGYLETLNITWADTDPCSTGKAVRTGKPCIVKNILTDSNHAPWRPEAVKRGYASCIALPLIANNHVFGALSINAKEPDAFDEEEVKLLAEMADDLAFGVKALRTRAERERAEEALQKSDAYLRLQIERMPIGCIVWDSDFRVVSWNPAAEEIFGFKEEEVSGKHPYGLIVPKAIQSHVDTIWRRLLEGDTTAHSINENITKDGRTLICSWSNTPLKEDGKVTGVLSMVQDITERKRAEKALRKSEEKYRSLVANIPDVTWTSDSEGNATFISSNVEKIYGFTQEEIYAGGESIWFGRIHPDDVGQVKKAYELLFAENKNFDVEYRIQRKDGQYIWLQDRAITSYEKDGVWYADGIFSDITAHKKAEEILLENQRLDAANKAKSDFLANMSHELRNPLNAIIGFSELLMQKAAGEMNEKQEKYVENVLTSSKHLLNLINDILDLSKVEAGKIELNLEKLHIQSAIEGTLTFVKEKAMKHNVTIKKEFGTELDFIEADALRLKQILFNLMDNAIKFSKPEGGVVTIRTEKEGDVAKISVSDTGIGIQEEDIGKLFQKFEQIDSGVSKKYGGSGLGLAITKQLVELHGGKISAESKFGEGSTFTFILPLKVKRE